LCASNKRRAESNQEPARDHDHDHDRQDAVTTFASVLARLRSPFKGERVAALRAAYRMLVHHFEDIAAALRRGKERDKAVQRAEIAVEAAAVLQAQINELEARLAAYERGGGIAVATWSDVATGNPQKQAAWMLAENAAKRLYLNSWEREFLPNIATPVEALTAEQESVLSEGPGGSGPAPRRR
jgi:hypothetical protein